MEFYILNTTTSQWLDFTECGFTPDFSSACCIVDRDAAVRLADHLAQTMPGTTLTVVKTVKHFYYGETKT